MTTEAYETEEAYETAFRARAERRRTLGFGLLLAASGIWLWLAYQLFVPFTIEYGRNDTDCASRVFYDDGDTGRVSYADAEGERCAGARDWAELLGMLLVSVPLAAGGVHQYASGSIAMTLRRHEDETARLRALPKG
ncbi:hypothetical protein ABZ128_23740 [Streptomyces sp. NPDC006326]|uniref:hypothetical protein n=1 Tax=Streptomyces sp. NPDC006326 TaxID=3156752 RepID=UPI0033ADB801